MTYHTSAIKRQFILGYAVLGCLQPYLPVFLANRGLNNAQVGDVLSVAGLAVMVTPIAITFLADAHLESRTLLMLGSVLSGVTLGGLLVAPEFWAILAVYALFSLAYMPQLPLQDGMNFSYQHTLPAERRVPYHRIRVWGAIGFIVPSLILFFWLSHHGTISGILVVAMIVCGLGILNAFGLPRLRSGGKDTKGRQEAPAQDGPAMYKEARRLPTVAALRAMSSRRMLVFLAAMWLCQAAAGAYYAFYPLYLTRVTHIDPQWVGLIANVGVFVEVFYLLALGWAISRFGMRRLFIFGALAVTARYGLLFAFPIVPVAVGTQIFHGIWVTTLIAAPVMFLDQHADSGYRNSMQGVYTMLILGTGRIAGSVLGGLVAQASLIHTFAFAALMSLVAAVLLGTAFRRPVRET